MTRSEELFISFWNKVDEKVIKAKINYSILADNSGIPYRTLTGWKNKGRLPDTASLLAIANALNTSVDSLLGNEKQPTVENKWAKYNEAMEHISLKDLRTIRVILGMDPDESTEEWKRRVI